MLCSSVSNKHLNVIEKDFGFDSDKVTLGGDGLFLGGVGIPSLLTRKYLQIQTYITKRELLFKFTSPSACQGYGKRDPSLVRAIELAPYTTNGIFL